MFKAYPTPLDLLAYVVFAGLAIIAAFLTLVGFARAQDVAPAVTTVVDLGPLVDLAIGIVAPVMLTALSGLATWVLYKIKARTGLQIEAQQRAAVEQGLARAVSYAVTRLESRAAGGIPIDLRSSAIAAAAAYAQKAVPDALAHFGITADRLSEMVEARLEGLLVDPDTEVADRTVRAQPIPDPIFATGG